MDATRRDYDDELVEVRAKMGRRVRCTPDHPCVVGDGAGGEVEIKLAEELTTDDWLPLALERTRDQEQAGVSSAARRRGARRDHARQAHRAPAARSSPLSLERRRAGGCTRSSAAGRCASTRWRSWRCRYAARRGATAKNGTEVASELELDEALWRVVCLYLAEGTRLRDGASPLHWRFHPAREEHLVDEVRPIGYAVACARRATRGTSAAMVRVYSRLRVRLVDACARSRSRRAMSSASPI